MADPNRGGRTGEASLQDLPCPRCGNRHILYYLLTDEQGRHQHTHYVCTFWGSGRQAACGWHGWTVPTETVPQR